MTCRRRCNLIARHGQSSKLKLVAMKPSPNKPQVMKGAESIFGQVQSRPTTWGPWSDALTANQTSPQSSIPGSSGEKGAIVPAVAPDMGFEVVWRFAGPNTACRPSPLLAPSHRPESRPHRNGTQHPPHSHLSRRILDPSAPHIDS